MAGSKDKLADYTPQRANANKHTPRGMGVLEKSIQADGWIGAITVAADGETFDGSARIEVGVATGFEDAIVVESDGRRPIIHVRKDIATADDPRARRLAISANRVAQLNLSWDVDQLLADVNAGLDLSALFRTDELDALIAAAGNGATGDAPDAQTDRADELGRLWGVQSGQLWEIPSATVKGKSHSLLIGDCRNSDDMRRLCAEKVQGVFTSPPYAEQRKEQYGGTPADEYVAWWEAVQANVRDVLKADGSFFVNIKAHCEDGERVLYVMDLVLAMRRQWGWRYIDELCWTHQGFPGEPQQRFQNAFEPIYHWGRGKIKFRPDAVAYDSDSVIEYAPGLNLRQRERATNKLSPQSAIKHAAGKAYPRNVLRISSASADVPEHSAAFPVALPDFFIRAYSDPGDVWLDPFCGSGTVIASAEKNKRLAFGCELLEKHGGVILQRLSDMDLQPRLMST